MKRGKATGPDGISIEIILALEEMGIGMTTNFSMQFIIVEQSQKTWQNLYL